MSETSETRKAMKEMWSGGALKEYHASCHCGFIKVKAKMDLSSPRSHLRCNCTICTKTGVHNTVIMDLNNLELISPASREEMSVYHFNKKTMNIYFCPTCGIRVFQQGVIADLGEVISLNLRTLDEVDLKQFKPEVYVDGRHLNWKAQSEPYSPGAW